MSSIDEVPYGRTMNEVVALAVAEKMKELRKENERLKEENAKLHQILRDIGYEKYLNERFMDLVRPSKPYIPPARAKEQ